MSFHASFASEEHGKVNFGAASGEDAGPRLYTLPAPES